MGHCHESGANVGPMEITNLLFLFLKFWVNLWISEHCMVSGVVWVYY